MSAMKVMETRSQRTRCRQYSRQDYLAKGHALIWLQHVSPPLALSRLNNFKYFKWPKGSLVPRPSSFIRYAK